jgi:hypothetical protein
MVGIVRSSTRGKTITLYPVYVLNSISLHGVKNDIYSEGTHLMVRFNIM